jgi:hypothetical protein
MVRLSSQIRCELRAGTNRVRLGSVHLQRPGNAPLKPPILLEASGHESSIRIFKISEAFCGGVMKLPAEFQPTTTTRVRLSDGRTICVPTCEPLLPSWAAKPPAFSFGGKPVVEHDGSACFAELAILRKFPPPWEGVWHS